MKNIVDFSLSFVSCDRNIAVEDLVRQSVQPFTSVRQLGEDPSGKDTLVLQFISETIDTEIL
jgi:hypothetical protein